MKEWCKFSGKIADGDNEVTSLASRVRCPECNRLLKPRIETCTGDRDLYCCIWGSLPQHKIRDAGGKKWLKKEKQALRNRIFLRP